MCRLLGILLSDSKPIGRMYNVVCDTLKRLCYEKHECHGDGCGIAWIDDDGWHIEKDTDPFWVSQKLRQLALRLRSRVYVLHARKSTFPLHSPLGLRRENNHPYMARVNGKLYVFAHNGHIIFDSSKLRWDSEHRSVRFFGHSEELSSYGTDSEIFFRLLVYFFRKRGGREPNDIIGALEDILHSGIIESYTAVNFILGGQEYLYALRLYYGEKDADKYTLYYAHTENRHQDTVTLYISSEPLADKTSRRGIGEPLVWKEIDNGELLYVPIINPAEIHIAKPHI